VSPGCERQIAEVGLRIRLGPEANFPRLGEGRVVEVQVFFAVVVALNVQVGISVNPSDK
jgi:hypothetical protein